MSARSMAPLVNLTMARQHNGTMVQQLGSVTGQHLDIMKARRHEGALARRVDTDGTTTRQCDSPAVRRLVSATVDGSTMRQHDSSTA
jgi:hypothetical protein